MGSHNNEYAYEHATISAATPGTTSSQVLAANIARRNAVVVNTGGTDVFLSMGVTAEVGKGIFLKAGGGSLEILAENLTHAAIHAITASGTSALSIQEGF